MIKRSDIIKEVYKYLDVPYLHQGRNADVGLDCIGLGICVFQHFDIPIIDLKAYGSSPDGVTLLEAIDKNLNRIPATEVLDGDLYVFWVRAKGFAQHIGFKHADKMVHTYSGSGRVVSHVINGFWKKRIMCGYRFKNAETE